MERYEVERLLNQLAEIQANVDLISIEENKLLESVQVPDDVKSIYAEGEKRKKELRQQTDSIMVAMDQELSERLGQIEVPPEIQEILLNIDRQRNAVREEIEQRKRSIQLDLNSRLEKVDGEFGKKVEQIYKDVETRKLEINLEFGEKKEAAQANQNDLIEKIKSAVKIIRESVKGKYNQAVYTKGRTTWKTDVLDDVYTILNASIWKLQHVTKKEDLPGIIADLLETMKKMTEARKEGDPSVSIRRIG